MNPYQIAKNLNLVDNERNFVPGSIEEHVVLEAIESLVVSNPDHEDLFILAADTVRSSRSAGFHKLDKGSVFATISGQTETQLRYRDEMANIFVDLSIDLALREKNGVRHERAVEPEVSPAN